MSAPAAWTRRTDLGAVASGGSVQETWEQWAGDRLVASFPVEVTVGKPLNVLGLKNTSLGELRDYAGTLATTAAQLYADPAAPPRVVPACPCCDAGTGDAARSVVINQVPYARCRGCGHVFVASQPTPEQLARVFTESDEHSAVYTDPQTVQIRLDQVVKPKLEWVMRTYRRVHGRDPGTVLDAGAGAGHFVAVCRRAGLEARGCELSRSSRRFAKQVFELDLDDRDFLGVPPEPATLDLLTMWGLLEYTPAPQKFVRAAHPWLRPDGMLIVEVPRMDCVSTAVQEPADAVVARHLDPTSHVNCFSDGSLLSALVGNGFRPVAAWYFGMDAYELLVQIAARCGAAGAEVIERGADLIPYVQAYLDGARACDDIVLACVPEVR